MERQVLQERIISALKRSPADKYLLQKQLQSATVAELSKAVTNLLEQKLIHVSSYRKSKRSGLDVPVFSAGPPVEQRRPDLHSLLPGVTSERLVEYDFVSKNLVSKQRSARILDVGANPEFARKLKEFSGGNWNVFGIDLSEVDGLSARMDVRHLGFQDETFDQILCISTIEHVGLAPNEQDDEFGDIQTMKELLRVLCKKGSLILTVPYGNRMDKTRTQIDRPTMDTRVYGRDSLVKLAEGFSIKRQEFYCYRSGRWQRCSQVNADKIVQSSSREEQRANLPLSFHSAACACLLLTHKNGTLA